MTLYFADTGKPLTFDQTVRMLQKTSAMTKEQATIEASFRMFPTETILATMGYDEDGHLPFEELAPDEE